MPDTRICKYKSYERTVGIGVAFQIFLRFSIVAKDRNKQGCVALKSRIGKHLSEYTRSLNASLPREGIQIIVISRPTAYGEYAPYSFVDTEEEFRNRVLAM